MVYSKKFSDLTFAVLLLGAVFFWLHGLSKPSLTLWDEVININIVKNLSNNSCVPMLHRQDFTLDFRGWDNNYIWLHKPLLPFYLNVFFYRIFGQSILAYRFLGLLTALISAVGIYIIGRKFFTPFIGLAAAALFISNSFILKLVHELQFSGFIDTCFLAALVWSLYYLLNIAESATKKNFLLFAVFGSLAFLCKSGLAFGPFFVLVLLCLRLGFKKNLGNLLYAALMTAFIIAPETVILAHFFPAQFFYEQSQYIQNFFADVEYATRPWDYYLSFYFSSVTGILMAGVSWFSIGYSAVKSKSDIKFFVLFSWIISYLFVLSFQVSKISNFLVPLLPPLCLLISQTAADLLGRGKFRLASAAGAGLILFYLALRLNLLNIKQFIYDEQSLWFRFLPIFAYLLLLAFIYIIILVFENRQKLKTTAYFLINLAVLVMVLSNAKTGWKIASDIPADSGQQTLIRESAKVLKQQLPENSILFTQTDKMQDDHLYFMYWSGFDSIEIRQYQSISILSKLVPQNQHVYVVSDVKQTGNKDVQLTYEFSIPFGDVYNLR